MQNIKNKKNIKHKKITLAHSGKQHSYHVARSMFELDVLDKFFTSSYIKNKYLQEYLSEKGNKYWSRRFTQGLSGKNVDSNWRFELKEIVFRKFFGKTIKTQNAIYERDIKFDSYVSKKLKHQGSCMYWGFQGSCYKSLLSAKNLGKLSVCELATAHVTEAKKILGEEQKLHPEWADSIDNLIFPPDYEKRLIEEPHVADFVIAASEFTRQSLLNDGIDENKIRILPLGFEYNHIASELNPPDIQNRALKVLYAGTVTQRKGIKYLLEAIKSLNSNDIELHIIGNIHGNGLGLNNYKGYYIKHNSVSQFELFSIYKDYDVLVLPSVFEGFGLVIVEALAAGVPVITTDHTIGKEIIENKKNGILLPIRNVQAIKDAILFFRNLNHDEYLANRQAAYNSVKLFSWDQYRKGLSNVLKTMYDS